MKINCHHYGESSTSVATHKIRLRLPVPYLTGLKNRLFKFFLKVLHRLLNRIHRFLFLCLGRIGIVERYRCF
jgi:hypothetical protein